MELHPKTTRQLHPQKRLSSAASATRSLRATNVPVVFCHSMFTTLLTSNPIKPYHEHFSPQPRPKLTRWHLQAAPSLAQIFTNKATPPILLHHQKNPLLHFLQHPPLHYTPDGQGPSLARTRAQGGLSPVSRRSPNYTPYSRVTPHCPRNSRPYSARRSRPIRRTDRPGANRLTDGGGLSRRTMTSRGFRGRMTAGWREASKRWGWRGRGVALRERGSGSLENWS